MERGLPSHFWALVVPSSLTQEGHWVFREEEEIKAPKGKAQAGGSESQNPSHLSEASTALHRAALLHKDSYIIRDNYQLDPRLPADNWQCHPLRRVLGSPASLLVCDSLLMFLPRSLVFVSACGHPGPTRLG